MHFHYTNIPAVYNIVKTGKVWFSSLAFMNDEMEGMDLHQVLAEVLELKYGSEKCKKTLELIETDQIRPIFFTPRHTLRA